MVACGEAWHHPWGDLELILFLSWCSEQFLEQGDWLKL